MQHTMNRRAFARLALAGLGTQVLGLRAPAANTPSYRRANTDWLAKCRYGVGVHWTAQTAPRHGEPAPFQRAVDEFKLQEFVGQVRHTGADYVLFTATHALHLLPAPHPVLDRILPGRTCPRDLIGELADALAAAGLPLLVYWNHSCNGWQDAAWRQAVGYDARDKNILARNLAELVAWMGERYGRKIKAWWFDSPYSLDSRGPYKAVTTDMAGFRFPWEQFTVAAKQGFADRLVTYNPGIAATYLYTTHQDYWAGEMVNLKAPATSRHLSNGLQWFGWTCLEDRAWVHSQRNTEVPQPLYRDEEVLAFVRACNRHQAPMTFNIGIYQDGVMATASVEQLRRVGAGLRANPP